MWDFILYCLKCVGIAIAGAFGQNPEGLSFKTACIGLATIFTILIIGMILCFGILFIIRLKYKNDQEKDKGKQK